MGSLTEKMLFIWALPKQQLDPPPGLKRALWGTFFQAGCAQLPSLYNSSLNKCTRAMPK